MSTPAPSSPPRRIAVIGGGAAGFFGAIAAAETLGASGTVTLYEATAHPLAKVLVSGGGRCNVTHACFDPRILVTKYPRGGRELLGAFNRFQPQDTIAWFAERGVELKTEEDGRMFPTTDSSATIADCLRAAARAAGVTVILEQGVGSISKTDGEFVLALMGGGEARADRVLVASGGNRSSAGFTIAAGFGHSITPLVPSLFTFTVGDARLKDLSGLSVPFAETSIPNTKLKESGPLLITHSGFSGPAVIKLSAWGARFCAECGYQFILRVNFCGRETVATATQRLTLFRAQNPRKQASSINPFEIPQRLWERLVVAAGVRADTPWTSIGNGAVVAVATQVCAAEFSVMGKSVFKEEFVTCGGVALNEVDFKTMESRRQPGLHFAGEVLDIDGVTGGFNFQSAWTTSWLAGQAMGT